MRFTSFTLWAVLIALLIAPFTASAETPTSDRVMADAKAKAGTDHKVIFLHFGASWCGWCHKLEAFLDKPAVKPVFDKYFVSVKIVVQENANNKSLENPGADAQLKDIGGPAGLPYYAFLDARGSLIVSSKLNGDNIGYPLPDRETSSGAPINSKEIDWFITMLQKAAPGISDAELKTIRDTLMSPDKA